DAAGRRVLRRVRGPAQIVQRASREAARLGARPCCVGMGIAKPALDPSPSLRAPGPPMRPTCLVASLFFAVLFATCTNTHVRERSGLQDPQDPRPAAAQGQQAPRSESQARPPVTGQPSPQ